MQIDRIRDTETDRKIDKGPDRQIETDIQIDRGTYRKIERYTEG